MRPRMPRWRSPGIPFSSKFPSHDALQLRAAARQFGLSIDKRQLGLEQPALLVEYIQQPELAQLIRLTDHRQVLLRLVDHSTVQDVERASRRLVPRPGRPYLQRNCDLELLGPEFRCILTGYGSLDIAPVAFPCLQWNGNAERQDVVAILEQERRSGRGSADGIFELSVPPRILRGQRQVRASLRDGQIQFGPGFPYQRPGR